MTATTGTESAYSCDSIFVVGFFILGFSKIRKTIILVIFAGFYCKFRNFAYIYISNINKKERINERIYEFTGANSY